MKVSLSPNRCDTSPPYSTQFEVVGAVNDIPMKVAVSHGNGAMWQSEVSSLQAAIEWDAPPCLQDSKQHVLRRLARQPTAATISSLDTLESDWVLNQNSRRCSSSPSLSSKSRDDDGFAAAEPDIFDSSSVVAMAQDQSGCSNLIERWTRADSCGREALLNAVLPVLEQFSCHPLAHVVVTTLLVTSSSMHFRQIAQRLSREVVWLAKDDYGCRVIQQALLRKEGAELLVAPLSAHIEVCSRHPCGNFVIQRLVEVLPLSSLRKTVRAVCAADVKRLSLDKFGCRVVQSLLLCCSVDIMYPILDELKKCSYDLLAHPFGNYVLQVALDRGRQEDRVKICTDMLRCDVISLRNDRCAHHLVEKCVFILGHAEVLELQELWTALCATLVSSDMTFVPVNARDSRMKTLKAFRELMLRSSVGSQNKELRRCLAACSWPRRCS